MESWQAFLDLLATNRLLQCAAILVASLLGAWLADRILTVVFRRLTARTKTEVDDQVLDILHLPIRTSVVLIGLVAITAHLKPDLDAATTAISLTRFVYGALATVAILLWTVAAVRLSKVILGAASRSSRVKFVEARTLPLFSNLARVLTVLLAIYFVFLAWGIDVTAWLAAGGIIGIAVGFAAKDTLANFFSGVFILADSPYQVGDFVNLSSGERGQVTHVGIRSTRLLTRDDIEITLPNSVIANSTIVNESGGPWAKERLRVRVGAAYGSDVDEVERVLLDAAASVDGVCAEPAPRVRFRSFGASSLDFELLCWIDEPVLRGRMLHELNRAVYKVFDAAAIEIPYSKHDVYLYSGDAEPAAGPASGTGTPPVSSSDD